MNLLWIVNQSDPSQVKQSLLLFGHASAVVAQSVEHIHGKDEVSGSIPDNGSMGRYSSGQRGQTVNLMAHAFEGSNPSRPTSSSYNETQMPV